MNNTMSEIDEILEKFRYYSESLVLGTLSQIPKNKLLTKAEAKQQLQALMLKERKDELANVKLEYGGRFKAITYISGEAVGIMERCKDLDTQIEQLEGKHE